MGKENKTLGMKKIKETDEFILYKDGDRLWQKCIVHKHCTFMGRAKNDSELMCAGLGIHLQRNVK